MYICFCSCSEKMANLTRRYPRTRTRTPCGNFFLRCGWGGRFPNSNFFKLPELSETSRARKLIFGLQVNIDKANIRNSEISRYAVDMVYRIGDPVPPPFHYSLFISEIVWASKFAYINAVNIETRPTADTRNSSGDENTRTWRPLLIYA